MQHVIIASTFVAPFPLDPTFLHNALRVLMSLAISIMQTSPQTQSLKPLPLPKMVRWRRVGKKSTTRMGRIIGTQTPVKVGGNGLCDWYA